MNCSATRYQPASIPAAVRRALDRQGAKVLLARAVLSVEVAMQVAGGPESGGGKTNREIAKLLFVSPQTVSAHFSHGFKNVESGLGSG